MPTSPALHQFQSLLITLAIGAAGGVFAFFLGIPMPFLLGSLLASSAVTISGLKPFGHKTAMPLVFRSMFVAVIGVMIGGAFTPALVGQLGSLWVAAVFVGFFVVISFFANYLIFKTIGRYDKSTAFFAAMPGGLIESIALGEKLGANIEALTLHQFSRIMLVITMLPFIFLIWTGEKVGSAAGVSMVGIAALPDLLDLVILMAAGVIGYLGGRALRLPAFILIGPLLASAAVHMGGLTDAHPPGWLVSVAQIVVGTGLGVRFSGFYPGAIIKALGLSLISVAMMLGVGAALAMVLSGIMSVSFKVLLISFAPGGVTETALIALSLNANPVFVTTLHIFRIGFAVVLSSLGAKKLIRGSVD